MTIKERTEKALLKIGFNPALMGFGYICEAIELLDSKTIREGKTTSLYKEIAKRNNTSYCRVERSIRHTFGNVLEKGDMRLVEKYLSLVNTTNEALLHTLWMNLQHEVKEEQSSVKIDDVSIDVDYEALSIAKEVNKKVLQATIKILEKELESYDN